MYKISYSNQASKFLSNTDKFITKRITAKIESLRIKPIIPDTKTIQGYQEKIFRIRVGDYRILYEIDYEINQIGIIKIDKRSRVYS